MKKIIWIVAAICITLLYGCSGNSVGNEKDEHAHENVVLQITEYSKDFELYAEANPFVVGQACNILTHFTFLKNFKPLENGSITASLIVGTKGIRQKLKVPTRKGIFLFTLTPTTEGEGKLVLDIQDGDGLQYKLIVPNIIVYSDKHDAEHAAELSAVQSSAAIAFLKEQSWKVDFATELPRKEPFGQIIKTTAQILSAQGAEQVVTSKSSGIVTFLAENLTEGKSVTSGTLLFSISGTGMAENNLNVQYFQAKSNFEEAKANYERNQKLINDKIITEQQFLESKNNYQNTKTIFENLEKNFSAGRENIVSPINGYIQSVNVKSGEFVDAGQSMAIISQNKNLLLRAEVKPKYYSLLSNITGANIKTIHDGKTISLDEIGGKIISYSKSADNSSFLIPVIFQIENNGNFVTRSFVEIFIKTQTSDEALTIPNSSILEEMGNYFVFVQLTPELFEKRLVKLSVTDGLRTEIKEGLTENDRIVTKGAVLVKLAQASGTLDAHSGHVH